MDVQVRVAGVTGAFGATMVHYVSAAICRQTGMVSLREHLKICDVFCVHFFCLVARNAQVVMVSTERVDAEEIITATAVHHATTSNIAWSPPVACDATCA